MQRSNNLKEFINEKKIKREEIGKITEWSRATVFRKIKGESEISDDDIKKIADFYGIDVSIFDLDEIAFSEYLVSNDKSQEFIQNVNSYIETKKIKKENISRRLGVHRTTLDRYLSKEIKIGSEEMIKIANALRKSVEYFLNEDFNVMHFCNQEQLAFFSGSPKGKQIETANNLIELLKYHDAIFNITELQIEHVKGDD